MTITKISKFDGRTTTASVKRHPMASFDASYAGFWVGVIETPSGRCYSCTWTRDESPSNSEVLDAWKTDRKAFSPLNR